MSAKLDNMTFLGFNSDDWNVQKGDDSVKWENVL